MLRQLPRQASTFRGKVRDCRGKHHLRKNGKISRHAHKVATWFSPSRRRLVATRISESDSDFETSRRRCNQIGLESAIERARLCIHRQRARNKGSVADEVRSKFPSHSRPGPSPLSSQKPSKRIKLQHWKVVPVCLDAPHSDTKGVLDGLCRRGLGSKLFTTEDRLGWW